MKVFLSSTHDDLIEHRKAAHDALEQLGLHVIWMEAFGARTEGSTRVCLKEIEESALFVGIYAHRYGYIPKDAKVSITEQEFDHAQKLGRYIFGFIINEDHPWPPKFIEHNKKAKLDAFLGKVKKQPVEFFTTPDNLANNIASSVGHYLSEHKPISSHQSLITPPRGSTLPSQPYFFGRAKELKIIKSALSPDSRTWGALIDGPGGIGKTALAIKAAHDAPKALFERKIFITAKVRELTSEGENRLTDFTRPTYLDMLNELGKELGKESITTLPPEERPNALRLALIGKKSLVIFDNLETLPEAERTRLFQFLTRLPEGNKAIVTSRRRTDVDARIVRLDHLAHDEAMQLITELATKYPRLARASPKERENLYEITQGNPLFIRWIAGQLRRTGSQCRTIAEACDFINKAPKGNDPLEYIFGDLLETLTSNETKVLAALTYFEKPAKLKWIAELAGLAERSAETTLEDLSDRAILTADPEARAYFLPPLAARFIRTHRTKVVAKTGSILTGRTYELVSKYKGFSSMDADWDYIAAGLPNVLKGDNDRLQIVCEQLEQFLEYTGRWDEYLWLYKQAEACALAVNDKENAGWRAYQAGMIYYRRNQPKEVLACAFRAAKHWKEEIPRNKAFAIRLRGHGHRLQGNYNSAIADYNEALEIWRKLSPESDDVADALNDLANTELDNKNYIAAAQTYHEALKIAEKVKYGEGVAIYKSNLAALAIDREEYLKAESLARETLELAKKVKRGWLIGWVCYLLADVLLKQNHALDEAFSLARQTTRIYSHLRIPELQEAQELMDKIKIAIQKEKIMNFPAASGGSIKKRKLQKTLSHSGGY